MGHPHHPVAHPSRRVPISWLPVLQIQKHVSKFLGGLGYPTLHVVPREVGSRVLHNICKNMEQSAIGSHNPVFMKKMAPSVWKRGGGVVALLIRKEEGVSICPE